MAPTSYILLSSTLTFGVPILLAIGQLRSLHRTRTPRRRPNDPPPPGDVPKHPKPLPDCLLRAAQGRPARVRDLV